MARDRDGQNRERPESIEMLTQRGFCTYKYQAIKTDGRLVTALIPAEGEELIAFLSRLGTCHICLPYSSERLAT